MVAMTAERYLLGDLGEEERAAYEAHFFSCPECAEEVVEASAFLEMTRFALGSPRTFEE